MVLGLLHLIAVFVLIWHFFLNTWDYAGVPLISSSLIALLTIKHFIADGPLQTSYQYQNKGTYGHAGGVLHSGIHAIFTLVVIYAWSRWFNVTISDTIMWSVTMLDYIIHYHCDWAKVRLTHRYNWSHPVFVDGKMTGLQITSNTFFIALLLDQLVHGLTYVVIYHVIMTQLVS